MFERITNLFRSEESVPDLIGLLDLRDWYLDLSYEERRKLYEYSITHKTTINMNLKNDAIEHDGLERSEHNPLEQNMEQTSKTPQEYLRGIGSAAKKQKDYKFSEMVLLSALEAENGSPTDTHFIYDTLIDVYYKQRDDRNDAIKKCIEYCKKDIEIADDFVDEFGEVPRIPSFKRLAIIYEKSERYEDALDVCDRALEIVTTDGTKGGFEGRKGRIRNKMEN